LAEYRNPEIGNSTHDNEKFLLRLKTLFRSVDEKCEYDGKAEEKQSNSRATTLTGTTIKI